MGETNISIIMSTYNRAHYIKGALDSIIGQTLVDWECIVIDDGSTDNTETVLREYVNKDFRIKYYKRPMPFKKGLSGSRNYGLTQASGKYVIFFDDDDIVHPDNLSICYTLLSNNEELFFCRYEKLSFTGDINLRFEMKHDFKTQIVGRTRIEDMVTGELPFASCSVLWKKECFENINFNEELHYAEEWECYTRILLSGFTGISIDKILYYNRKHQKSNTGEFYNKNEVRRLSYINSIILVINHLDENNMLTITLQKFLIRLGFFLKDYSVINQVLRRTNSGKLRRIKFLLGFKFYPMIRPVFLLKQHLKHIS